MDYAAIGLDVATVAVVGWCTVAAAKKGFLRTVIQMIAYVAILLAAAFFSKAAAPVLYDRVVEPMLLSRAGQTDEAPPARKNAALIAAGPEDLLSSLEDALDGARDVLGDAADGLLPGGDPAEESSLAEDLADVTLRPLMVNAIQMVTFAVVFAVLSLLANVMLSTLGLVRYLPVVGTLNALLGAVVGVLQGLLIVWMLALLLRGLLDLYPGGVWVFPPEVVGRTWLFKYFADPALAGKLAH